MLSIRAVRWIVTGMFLLGIPVAVLFLIQGEPLPWNALRYGTVIWLLWLLRLGWSNMPDWIRMIIWSVSFIWHLLFVPLFLYAMLFPITRYLMAHCLVMLGCSALLLLVDRRQKILTDL